MPLSHKSQIVLQTLAPYVVAYSLICLVLLGNSFSSIVGNWEKLLAVGFLSVALGLLQDLIPKPFKEWLVFWRLRDRTAGHRAFRKGRNFSQILERREVIDIELRESLETRTQDRLFYRLYDRYREKGNVKHFSFRYLQWRELASTALITGLAGYLVVSSNVGFFEAESFISALIPLFFCLLSIIAARSSSNQLVDYVLLAEYLEKTEN